MTVYKGDTIRRALETIDRNRRGMVMVCDEMERVIGTVTDGDIRKKILENSKLDERVISCTNVNFVRADKSSTREQILKLFRDGVNHIPVLSENGKLVDVISRDTPPIKSLEPRTLVHARAPVRVSFGGGGSDVTTFFEETPGAVLNSTINLYAYATLQLRTDKKIQIQSRDLQKTIAHENLASYTFSENELPLIWSILQLIKPAAGFDLEIHSDFPFASGLGGSSAIAAAVLGCFNELREEKWGRYELAELTYQAERLVMNSAGGWQDQYATIFGGFNLMEFQLKKNVIIPLAINQKAIAILESCLFLVDTEIRHDSSQIHNQQKKNLTQNHAIRKQVGRNVELTYQIRDSILFGRYDGLGRLLSQSWIAKKSFAPDISSKAIDDIYSLAIENGSTGGKLLGAGGGGFFLFYVPQQNRGQFSSFLEKQNLKSWKFNFENSGLISWSERRDV